MTERFSSCDLCTVDITQILCYSLKHHEAQLENINVKWARVAVFISAPPHRL